MESERRPIAVQNYAAVLDGAERLLTRAAPVNISAVATEAGLSRPTVYAHFPDRRALLEALVERGVERTAAQIESAGPDQGPAPAALERVLDTGWESLGRQHDLVRAASAELGPEALRRAHGAIREAVKQLMERGQAEGDFRDDVGAGWLTTACLALIHAGNEEVLAGGLSRRAAREAVGVSVAALVEPRA